MKSTLAETPQLQIIVMGDFIVTKKQEPESKEPETKEPEVPERPKTRTDCEYGEVPNE